MQSLNTLVEGYSGIDRNHVRSPDQPSIRRKYNPQRTFSNLS